MKLNKNWILAAVAGVLVPAAMVLAQYQGASLEALGTMINCQVAGSCNIVAEGATPTDNATFGASADVTTNWTAGDFSSDLAVGGALTVTGTSTFNGQLSGVPTALDTTMSSSATTTACSVLNSGNTSRVVVGLGVLDTGTASSAGTVAWIAGTSTASGVAPATNEVDSTITRAASVDIITTTSTAQSSSVLWRTGERMNFVSGTTTNAGTCKILYY